MRLKKTLDLFSSIIDDPSLFEHARIIPSSFTRENGKMPLKNLLTYLLFRCGKTVLEDVSAVYPDLSNDDPPSKQAVLKRMSILNYDVWIRIQKLFLERIYKPLKKETYKGYLLLAVDGTLATLPKDPALSKIFGQRASFNDTGENRRSSPQAKVSMMYDVLNRVILDYRIVHQDEAELNLLFEHLETLEDLLREHKVILLADRNYGSAELFKYCEMKGYKYIIRAKSNFFKHQREKLDKETDDISFTVDIDEAWQKRIKRDHIRGFIRKHSIMKIRLLRNHYEYDEEYLDHRGKKHMIHHSVDSEYFSSLNEDLFSKEDIVKLYHNDRWDIETGYGTMKTYIDIEQVNSHNPITVMNEISARMVFYNLESLIFKASEDKKDKDHLPNNKHIIEMCRSSLFVSSFFKRRFRYGYLRSLIDECSRVKVMVRQNRHYKRWNKFRVSLRQERHRIDGKNNPPLKLTKAGVATSNH